MSDMPTPEFIAALRATARQERDPDKRAQLEADALRVEDVWYRSGEATAPTRDAMAVAMGQASLALAEQMDGLFGMVKNVLDHVTRTEEATSDIHTDVKELRNLPARIEALESGIRSLNTQFKHLGEEAMERYTTLSDEVAKVNTRGDRIESRVDSIEEGLKLLRHEVLAGDGGLNREKRQVLTAKLEAMPDDTAERLARAEQELAALKALIEAKLGVAS